MKKISLLALAVPALFAACSQEDFIVDPQGQQSAELLGEVAGKLDFVLEDGSVTRVDWADNTAAPTWTSTDKFSMFWVGATGENVADKGDIDVYKAASNAIYYQEDGKFSSQSVIYVGKHLLVSPADLAHVTDQEIVVSVGAEQKESVKIGDRTVLVSPNLINVKNEADKKDTDPAGTVYAGYNANLAGASVGALSSNIRFDLNFGTQYEKDVVVKKVELIALGDKEPFVTEANLYANANGHISALPTTSGQTGTVAVILPENQLIPENGILPVHFSLLPSVVDQLSETVVTPASPATPAAEAETPETPSEPVTTTTYTAYKIVVYTNYGNVTIDNASLVYKGSDANKVYQYDGVLAEGAKFEDIQELPLGFYTEFYDCAVRDIDDPATTEKNEAEAVYGNYMSRTVSVDMSTADINGMEIKTSADIVNYFGVYKKLGKIASKSAATFNLMPETATFEMTKEASDLLLNKDYQNITLANQNVTAIKLVNSAETGTFTDVPAYTTIKKGANNDLANIDLVLTTGEWTLNVLNAANFNAWKSVTNNGTLTVKSETVTNGVDLNKALTNNAAVKFSTAVEFPVAYTQAAATATTDLNNDVTFEDAVAIEAGQLTIASGHQVYFNEATSAGDITVNGYLNAAGNFENNGKVTNNGVVIIAAGGTFVNKNEMLVNKAANRTYINANEGIITIMDRQENLVISEANKQGVIAYTATDENNDYVGDAFVGKAGDKFNKLTVTRANLDLTRVNAAGTVVTSLVLDVYEAGKFEQFIFANGAEFAEVVVGKENKGTQTYSVDFVSAELTIGDLTVMPNTELHVVPGSEIIYTGTAIDNQGAIAVGGIFRAENMMEPNFTGVEKKYKSAGYGGSFYWNNSNSVEDYLAAMLADASISEIVLPENVELASALTISRDVTLNLNGKSVTAAGDAFEVTNGTLTITGNGTVAAGEDGTFVAVWANGGNVVIENGSFSVGTDANGKCNDCIYAKGGTITINGGTYTHAGTDSTDGGAVVNAHNSVPNSKVIVNGGTFTGHQIKEEGDITAGRVVWNIK